MAIGEREVRLVEAPDAAIQKCVRALTIAKFKNIQTNHGAMIVTAQKRPIGSWTKSPVTLTIKADGGGSLVTVLSQAGVQSLVGAASSPAGRLVDQVVQALARS
jgi:hypothetical protein